jgi:hypothetical protein
LPTFAESFAVIGQRNAELFAAGLFVESFAVPFPRPRDNCGLPISTPPENWRQYVAFYKWSDTHFEPIGFCNWIRYGTVYLEGGMCVRRNFYRRLPRDHWEQCRAAGGVAQLMMEKAAVDLNDCDAWFGYCGDKKASIVDARVGYVPTRHKYLIAKWFRELREEEKRALEDKMSEIGPF